MEPYAVTNDRGFIRQNEAHDEFGYMKDVDRKAYNIVMPNSFAYNPARINVGSIGYYEGTENVIVSSLYEVFQTADYVDDRFLWHWFKSDIFPKWIERLQEGSVRLYFYYDKLCECKMLMPSLPEQRKIAATLDEIDNLITLHQRKCDETKKLKKFMLQKMFPKNGERVPEIRFAGFTDDWEQRKLYEIADKAVDNRGKTPTISEDGTHPLLEVASLGNGTPDYSKVTKYLSDETFETELRAYIKEGDILFSTVGSIGLVSLMDANENAAIAQNIVAFRANEKYDSKFLYAMLSTEDNQYKAQRIVMGAVQPSIKVSQLVDVEYCVTENIDEQRKLGDFFIDLDNLITLHQRKCDDLKEVKKYMLQNMFPAK